MTDTDMYEWASTEVMQMVFLFLPKDNILFPPIPSSDFFHPPTASLMYSPIQTKTSRHFAH